MSSFDHIGLSVASLEGASRFYVEAFGFGPEFAFELDGGARGAMLAHPDGYRLELFERVGSTEGIRAQTPIEALAIRGYGHFALAAADIEPPFRHAVAAGARAVREPGPSPEPGVRFAFLADPEGNLIELVERQ